MPPSHLHSRPGVRSPPEAGGSFQPCLEPRHSCYSPSDDPPGVSLGAAAPGSRAPSHLLPLHACRDLGPHARGQQALAALLPAGTDSAQGQPSVGAWPGLGQQWQRWRDRKSQGPILRGCHGGRAGPGIRKRPSPRRPRCTLHLPALASCFDGPRNQSQGFIHVYSGPCTLVHSPGAV